MLFELGVGRTVAAQTHSAVLDVSIFASMRLFSILSICRFVLVYKWKHTSLYTSWINPGEKLMNSTLKSLYWPATPPVCVDKTVCAGWLPGVTQLEGAAGSLSSGCQGRLHSYCVTGKADLNRSSGVSHYAGPVCVYMSCRGESHIRLNQSHVA